MGVSTSCGTMTTGSQRRPSQRLRSSSRSEKPKKAWMAEPKCEPTSTYALWKGQ